MGFAVTCLALRDYRMLTTVTESTGEFLVLGYRFLHLLTYFFMAWNTECAWCGYGIVDLQWMVGRMAAETVTDYLSFCMGLMTIRTIRYLPVHIVTERTGLFSMRTFIVGEILSRSFMTGEAWFFYIIGKLKGKRFMGIGVAGEAVFQLEVGLSLMAHGAFRDDVLTPGRMFCVTVQAGNFCLVFAAVIGDGCGCILVTFYTV
jgi:hypothetical protein